jgi:hypothetical protein
LNKTLDGYDLQLSGAISDNVGLMFNGTYLSYKRSDYYRKHIFGELGIGLFSKQNEYMITEIYFGAGLGSSSLKENIIFCSEDADVNANYFRLSFQPVFGVGDEGVECGLTMRTCYVNFYNIKHSNIDFAETKFLFEPVIFFRIGPPFLQLQGQFGFSFDPIKAPLQIPFSDEWIMGIGFNIRPELKKES